MDSSSRTYPSPIISSFASSSSPTLAPPGRGVPSTSSPSNQSQKLPPPPLQWHADETMRLWLQAKSEEDRRLQEEEKTRQESLRLERRKVELSILQESVEAGIPPNSIPLVFAGINFQETEIEREREREMKNNTWPSPNNQPLQQPVMRQSHQLPQHSAAFRHPTTAGISSKGNSSTDPGAHALYSNRPPTSGSYPQQQMAFAEHSTSVKRLPTLPLLPAPPPPLSPQREITGYTSSPSTIHFHHWVPPGSSSSAFNDNHNHQRESSSFSSYIQSSGRKRKAHGRHHHHHHQQQ